MNVKRLLYFLLVFALVLIMTQAGTTTAFAEQSGVFTYSISGSTAEITYYTGTGGALIIPAKLGGYTVTSIGDYAFEGYTGLTSVTIPASVTNIGYAAFGGSDGLTQIIVNNNNINYSSFAGVLFNKNKSTLLQYPGKKTGSTYVIPNSVTNIGDSAFQGCIGLTSMTIPNSVINIGDSAFQGCTGLKSVSIPTSVTSIGYSAFSDCTRLMSVSIPNSVININDYAFFWCSELTSVSIPKSVASIGDSAFGGCDGLKQIIVDNSNTYYSSLDGVLFNKNKSTLMQYPNAKVGSSYAIPDSVTSINYAAFQGCTVLTSVIIPSRVSTIDDYAFDGCTGLTIVKIPNSVTSIGNSAFSGCTGLSNAYFFGNAPAMDTSASVFYGCAPKFTVYCLSGKIGFAIPIWQDYRSAIFEIKHTPLPAPTGLMIVSGNYNSIKLTWSVVAGASGYGIYRSTTALGTYSFLTTANTNGYTNTGLATGSTYYYKIQAYKAEGIVRLYGNQSGMVSAKPVPAIPVNLNAVSANYNSIKLTWNAVTGASGYGIYRSITALGTFSFLTTSTTNSYINTGLATGSMYYYKIKAYRAVVTTRVYGNETEEVSVKPVPATPTSLTAAFVNYSSIKLSWNTVTGASGYGIYRSTTALGTFTFLATATTNSYTNTGLAAGSTYFYKIKAYRAVGSVRVYGNETGIVKAQLLPATPTSLNAAFVNYGSIKLSWSAVTGASGYGIYRSASALGTYSFLTTAVTNSYTNTGLPSGSTYYYKVRAYRAVGTVRVYGGETAAVSAKTN